MKKLFLNCDLGEGMKNDAAIMPYLSSCNIACGGHYGDKNSIEQAIRLALKYKVAVGAHPSFEDKENFGRKLLDWDRYRFRESVTKQLHLFTTTAASCGVSMNHIKMHGALYHAVAQDDQYAHWCIELLQELYPKTLIYGPPNSLLQSLCVAYKQPFFIEAFADRAYLPGATLASRQQEGAVLHQVDAVVDQISSLVHKSRVTALGGRYIKIKPQTICLHGDNKPIIARFNEVIEGLFEQGIRIA